MNPIDKVILFTTLLAFSGFILKGVISYIEQADKKAATETCDMIEPAEFQEND